MAGHIASAKSVDWATPPHIVRAAHETFGGPPDLDPCSNPKSIVGARRAIQLPEDGLKADWSRARSCLLNPPYGRGIEFWVERAVKAWRDHGTSILLLVPAAVDTRYWQRFVATADAVTFLRGRLRFIGAPACAPFASAVAFWAGPGGGARRELLARYRVAFGELGTTWWSDSQGRV